MSSSRIKEQSWKTRRSSSEFGGTPGLVTRRRREDWSLAPRGTATPGGCYGQSCRWLCGGDRAGAPGGCGRPARWRELGGDTGGADRLAVSVEVSLFGRKRRIDAALGRVRPSSIGQRFALCVQSHAWKKRTVNGTQDTDAELDAWTSAEQLLWMSLIDQQWLVDLRVPAVPPQLLSANVSWSELPLQLLDCSCLNGLVSVTAARLVRETLSLDALLTLNLSGWEDQVSDELLEALALRCQRLEDVNVSHCSQLTDRGLGVLIDANISTLQRLSANGLRHLTGEVSVGAIEKCSRLHTLELEDCMSLMRLPNMFAQTPSVTALNIQGLSQFTDAQLGDVLTGIFPRLRCLHLGESELSGTSLMRLLTATATTSLREVDLSWCTHIDGDAIAELVRRSPDLRVIRLRCTHVDDKALEWIGCRSPSLAVLDLERCDGLTPRGFDALVASALRTGVDFRCLETLNLSWTSVSVGVLGRLLEQCADTITSVRVQGCKDLHSGLLDTMLALASQWPRLKLLDCSWINDIGDDKLQCFRDAVPNAAVIGYYGIDEQ